MSALTKGECAIIQGMVHRHGVYQPRRPDLRRIEGGGADFNQDRGNRPALTVIQGGMKLCPCGCGHYYVPKRRKGVA